jgi:hypothetical protein
MTGLMRSVLLLGCSYFLLGASSLQEAVRSATSSQPTVATFLAHDYGFEGPDTVPSGLTVLRLQNRGQESHHIQLVQLTEGKSPSDLAAAFQGALIEFPRWAKRTGGPNGVGSGGEAEALLDLQPGSYVLICLIPAKDGTPHVVSGMQKPLRVVEKGSSTQVLGGDYHMACLIMNSLSWSD